MSIGIDQNSWYRTGIVSKPKKLVSPITSLQLCKPQSYQISTCERAYSLRAIWPVEEVVTKFSIFTTVGNLVDSAIQPLFN